MKRKGVYRKVRPETKRPTRKFDGFWTTKGSPLFTSQNMFWADTEGVQSFSIPITPTYWEGQLIDPKTFWEGGKPI